MRNGDWFLTFTGKQFYPIDPNPEDICIEDIAHSFVPDLPVWRSLPAILFSGTALGSCQRICLESPFVALMHDATEAYVGDMVRPLKVSLPEYQCVEERVWEAICEKFDIPKTHDGRVKLADNVALITEARDILTPFSHHWVLREQISPLAKKIEPVAAGVSEKCSWTASDHFAHETTTTL